MSASHNPSLLLGNHTPYPTSYDPKLLTPIPRKNKWIEMGIAENTPLPFTGVDIWTVYELSWLDPKGKPIVAVGEIEVPLLSPFLIESKSLKLYLNSLNQESFADKKDVQIRIENDLTKVAGSKVKINIVLLHEVDTYLSIDPPQGVCIDTIDITINNYDLSPEVLKCTEISNTSETLYSNLLKSNCPVTDQPDWATIIVEYEGPQICQESLLRYIISYRQHNDFHEQCVERIFLDILNYCKPSVLNVHARYVRRGGLDINPFRSTQNTTPKSIRLVRQ